MKLLLKHFAESRKEKLYPNGSSILSNLKIAKTSTKESVIILKMTKFRKKSFAVFHDIKEWRFSFLITDLLLIFVDREIFFKNI